MGYCEVCLKSYGDPKILGTRKYCPHCGDYMGTTTKPETPNLPSTWWRTRKGAGKTLKTIQDEGPKP